jgi:transcription initiation factor TFIIB
MNVTGKKTKKNQRQLSFTEKTRLWEIFDQDVKTVEEDPEVTGPEETTELEATEAPTETAAEPHFHRCQACQNVLTITEDGFPTCTNSLCSIIYKNVLDYSPEWRYYGAGDGAADPTRCGNPINPLLVESSFGCKILGNSRSSYEMKKIRKWTEWQSTTHREKSLYEEFQFITIMAQNAGIPKIFIDYAMVIHKDISEQKMFRGMNRDGIKAASIYISCRLNQCPRTAHEIAEIFKLDKQSTTYGCSMAVNIFNNIERNMAPSHKTELGTTTPSAFIERYCSRLNIPNELAILAKFIAQKVESNNIVCDNTPQSSAAGIVFFVSQICHLNITKVDIKGICGVSEVTINKCFKKLDSIREQLVPRCILDKY